MPQDQEPDATTLASQTLPPRSEAFRKFMAAPLVTAVIFLLATGSLALLAWRGGEATGPRARIRFESSCAVDAAPIVQRRVDEIGLGQPKLTIEPAALQLEATLPGNSDDLQAVPDLLAREGKMEVGPPGSPVLGPSDIVEAQLRLDESGMPYTWVKPNDEALVRLQAVRSADPEGTLEIRFDGENPTPLPNDIELSEGGFRVLTAEGVTRERMRVAADRTILLHSGPLPCTARVTSVEVLPGGEPAN